MLRQRESGSLAIFGRLSVLHLIECIIECIDTFDGAKPRFLNRGKKRRSVSTLSIPRASARGVEWVDLDWQDNANDRMAALKEATVLRSNQLCR